MNDRLRKPSIAAEFETLPYSHSHEVEKLEYNQISAGYMCLKYNLRISEITFKIYIHNRFGAKCNCYV